MMPGDESGKLKLCSFNKVSDMATRNASKTATSPIRRLDPYALFRDSHSWGSLIRSQNVRVSPKRGYRSQ
jgi:hypothetical protein